MIRSRWRSLQSDDGIAIIVAIMVILVVGIFAATVATSSVSLSRSANTDRDSKKALAAAEAGMRRMLYLLNTRGEDLCLPTDLSTGDITVPVGSGSVTISGAARYDCAKPELVDQPLGNGMSYSVYMSPILAASAPALELQVTSCVGLPLDDLTLIGGPITRVIPVNQRCVTSIGKSNDVTRRIEARVAALTATQLFKVGLTGRDRTCIAGISSECPLGGGGGGQGNDPSLIRSDIGSNVLVDTGNIRTCGNRYIAPGGEARNGADCLAPYPGAPGEFYPVQIPSKSTFTCPSPSNPTATSCPPGTVVSNPQPPPNVVLFFESYRETRCLNVTGSCNPPPPSTLPGANVNDDTTTVNDNLLLPAVIAAEPNCQTNGANRAQYDSTTRILNLNGCKNILLPSGTYNLCNITNTGNLQQFGANPSTTSSVAPVVIMFDGSNRRTSAGADASGCGATADIALGGNNMSLIVPSLPASYNLNDGSQMPDSLALQIFAIGNPACDGWSSTTACTNAGQAPHRITIANAGAGANIGVGIFAPNSQFAINNSGNGQLMTGAFYARWLDMKNGFEFQEDPRYTTQAFPPVIKQYARTTWRECPPGGFSGTVRSGC